MGRSALARQAFAAALMTRSPWLSKRRSGQEANWETDSESAGKTGAGEVGRPGAVTWDPTCPRPHSHRAPARRVKLYFYNGRVTRPHLTAVRSDGK